MRIYLSGGIAYAVDHRASFYWGAVAVQGRGHEPVNPLDVPPWCGQEPDQCPDLVNGGQANKGHTWRCWMRGDLAVLIECDGILVMPGWESSHGARRELDLAATCGLQVFFRPQDIPKP